MIYFRWFSRFPKRIATAPRCYPAAHDPGLSRPPMQIDVSLCGAVGANLRIIPAWHQVLNVCLGRLWIC